MNNDMLTFYLKTKEYNTAQELASEFGVPLETIIIRAIELGEKAVQLQEKGIQWHEYILLVMKIQEKVVRIQNLLSQHRKLELIVPQIEESLRQAEADRTEAQALLSQLDEIVRKFSPSNDDPMVI